MTDTADGAPAISVVIPVYNGARFLAQALDSVRAQDFDDYEVVVVDDASTDDSAAIASQWGARVLRHDSNRGAAAAKNTGVKASTGEFIAFLDSDDTWHPEKLRQQHDYLREHPHVGYVVCYMQDYLEPGHDRPFWLPEVALERPQLVLCPSILMARRTAFDAVGFFDPQYEIGEDTEWFYRCARGGVRRGIIEQPLTRRRIHDRNLCYRTPNGAAELPRYLKLMVDRKRRLAAGAQATPAVES